MPRHTRQRAIDWLWADTLGIHGMGAHTTTETQERLADAMLHLANLPCLSIEAIEAISAVVRQAHAVGQAGK